MRLTLFFIISATVFALGESIKCYDCFEARDSNQEIPGKKKCEMPFSSSDNNPKCTEGYYCMKGVVQMDGESAVIRSCVDPNTHYSDPQGLKDFPEPVEVQMGPTKISAHLCKKDLCNSASLPTTTVSFLISFVITLLLV